MVVKFWLEDYTELFRNITILPNGLMTEEERLNALTRLILVIAVLLLIFRIGSWLYFLLFGIVLVIILYYYNKHHYHQSKSVLIENYRCPKHPKLPPTSKFKFKFKPRSLY